MDEVRTVAGQKSAEPPAVRKCRLVTERGKYFIRGVVRSCLNEFSVESEIRSNCGSYHPTCLKFC